MAYVAAFFLDILVGAVAVARESAVPAATPFSPSPKASAFSTF